MQITDNKYNQGAEVKPLLTRDALERRQQEATTDERNDVEWAGTISIGTPAQNFLIDFDSKCTHSLPLLQPRMLIIIL